MTIPALPPAPALGDSPEVFNTKAFEFVAALDDWGTEANATGIAVNANAVSADADAATATTQAGIATTGANTATTQAGIATTKAGEAATSANSASSSATAANLSAVAAAASAASIDPATLVKLTGDQTIAGVKTFTSKVIAEGLTVGKGAGSVASNTVVGSTALASNSTGAQVVALGYGALNANTASDNTAVGYLAAGLNTSGTQNTVIGRTALYSNTTGSKNISVGEDALRSNTTASNNTAVGYQAGYTNTTGSRFVNLGAYAGYSNSTGTDNVFIGYAAGYSATGSYNTFVGARNAAGSACGELVTSGAKNTIIGGYSGNQGGLDIRTASNYIVLSDGDGNPRGVFDNNGNYMVGTVTKETRGVTLYGTGANGFYVKTTGTSGYLVTQDGTGGAGTYLSLYSNTTNTGSITTNGTTTTYGTTSDYRLKENVAPMTGALAKVAALKPVTYTWKETGKTDEGFIAHELQEICPSAAYGEKDAVDADGNPVYQGIDTSFLVATLTAAIQELNAKFEAYKEAHP